MTGINGYQQLKPEQKFKTLKPKNTKTNKSQKRIIIWAPKVIFLRADFLEEGVYLTIQ